MYSARDKLYLSFITPFLQKYLRQLRIKDLDMLKLSKQGQMNVTMGYARSRELYQNL